MTEIITKLGQDIAELRVVTDRLQKSHDETLLEIKGIGLRMISVAEITTELREYRKTLHERFRHVTEQISEERIEIGDLQAHVTAELAEVRRRHEAAVDEIHRRQEAAVDKADVRLTKIEGFTIRWEANWKVVVAVLTGAAAIVSSLLSAYVPTLFHKM